MSIDKTPQQVYAADVMHKIGGFYMPELCKACDDAHEGDVKFRFMPVLMMIAIEEGKIVIGNSVMFDERMTHNDVVKVISLALTNMRRDDGEIINIDEGDGTTSQ